MEKISMMVAHQAHMAPQHSSFWQQCCTKNSCVQVTMSDTINHLSFSRDGETWTFEPQAAPEPLLDHSKIAQAAEG